MLKPLKNCLENAFFYSLYNSVLKATMSKDKFYIKQCIHAQKGNRILDIGCGPGNILDYFPEVYYEGFDSNKKYIDRAIKKYGKRGIFYCQKIAKNNIGKENYFDIVLATGVMHHLDDSEVLDLLNLAKISLRPGGRLVTLDGVFRKDQSWLIKLFLKNDRGKFIREQEKYLQLAGKVFDKIEVHFKDDLSIIPYHHLILICEKQIQ
jgi:SAM-dependent methyltransferase